LTRPAVRRALLFAAAAVLMDCGPSEEQAAALGQYLLESLAFARQTADTATIEGMFQPDAIYDDYPAQVTHRGIEEILGYLTSVHEWGDDVYLNLGSVQAGPIGATGEWTLTAVQSRPVPDLVGGVTHREVVVSGVTVIEIRGGRIARAADYWDRAGFLLQLGARIEVPGGTVLEENP
jgi:hypothetical protein